MPRKGKKPIPQIDILRAVKLHEPVTGPQLAHMFKRTRQSMHLRLRAMERRGLIERIVPDPEAPVVPIRYRCSFRLRELERALSKTQPESDSPVSE
jgi:hypothetical protein